MMPHGGFLWLLVAAGWLKCFSISVYLVANVSSQEGSFSSDEESFEQTESPSLDSDIDNEELDEVAASEEVSQNPDEAAEGSEIVESLIEKLNALSNQEELTSREKIAAFRKITENYNRAKLHTTPSKANEVMKKFQLLDSVDEMDTKKRIELLKKLAENQNRAELDLQPSRALTIMEKFHMIPGTEDMTDQQKIAVLKKLALDQNAGEKRRQEEIEIESLKPTPKPSLRRFKEPIFAKSGSISSSKRSKFRRFPRPHTESERQEASRLRVPGGRRTQSKFTKPVMSMIVISTPEPTPAPQPEVRRQTGHRGTFNLPSGLVDERPGQSEFPPVFGPRVTLRPKARRPLLNAFAGLREILKQGDQLKRAEQQRGFEPPPGLGEFSKQPRDPSPFQAQPQNGAQRGFPNGFPNLLQLSQNQGIQRAPPAPSDFFAPQPLPNLAALGRQSPNPGSHSFLGLIPSNDNFPIPSPKNGPDPFSLSPNIGFNQPLGQPPRVIPNSAALGRQPPNQGQSFQSSANSQLLSLPGENPFSISPSIGNFRQKLSQGAQLQQNFAAFNQDFIDAQSIPNLRGQQGTVARRPQNLVGSQFGSGQSGGVPFGQSTGIGQPQDPNQIMPQLLPAVQELIQSGLNQAAGSTGGQLPMQQQAIAQSLAAMQKLAKPPQKTFSNLANAAREAMKSISRANKAAQSSKTPVGTWLKNVFGSIKLPGINQQQKVPEDFRV